MKKLTYQQYHNLKNDFNLMEDLKISFEEYTYRCIVYYDMEIFNDYFLGQEIQPMRNSDMRLVTQNIVDMFDFITKKNFTTYNQLSDEEKTTFVLRFLKY